MAESIQGVLLHDIDVTDGPETVAIMTQGYINANRTDSDVQALLEAQKANMPKIHIIKR
ncbi:hypothetical protein IWT25_00757 [Secundilactobacillus pentosiphilus]|uniref:Uncharacterized protein n=1 Tax=Secundilactobacillus pentosiphilus TaxID=1714682 RepID=A0A1Z5IVI8_9LACO|nr:hypothetical protein [Secundilactobacillus pentosiphilus]GAX05451.1 hypothetical protein IWT25_00757 [Secundilactobacillus pentosiphilus]